MSAARTTPRDTQHIKYNFNHVEMQLFEAWNAKGEQDHGVVLCLNVGDVRLAGKPIFFEIPCSRFAVHGDVPVTLAYYPPETITVPPGSDEPPRMHVFLRSPEPISDDMLRTLGYADCARMAPEKWLETYEATTKHLTTITIKYDVEDAGDAEHGADGL